MTTLLYHFCALGIHRLPHEETRNLSFLDPYPVREFEKDFSYFKHKRILWAAFENYCGRINSENLQLIFPFATPLWHSHFLDRYYSSSAKLCDSFLSQVLFNSQRTLLGTKPIVDVLQYVDNASRFWSIVLDLLGIKCIISTVQPHSLTDLILFFICKQNSINFIVQVPAGMYSTSFMLDMTSETYITNINTSAKPQEFEEFEEFLLNCSGNLADHRTVYSQSINTVYQEWISAAKESLLFDTLSGSQLLQGKISLTRHYDRLCAIKPIPHGSFKHYLFLHYQPEATTSPMAKEFADQRKAVHYIYSSLNDDEVLVVKEHPYQFISAGMRDSHMSHIKNCLDYRSLDFYDDIISYPRVFLLPRSIKPVQVLNDLTAKVYSPTGTILLQAFLRNISFSTLDTYGPYNILDCLVADDKPRVVLARNILGPFLWPMFRGLDTEDIFMLPEEAYDQVNMLLRQLPHSK